MLKEAFRDNALGLTQTYEWFTSFNEGLISVDDDELLDNLRQEL
jgi:hypothetical protein